jgi:hypothetical protein
MLLLAEGSSRVQLAIPVRRCPVEGRVVGLSRQLRRQSAPIVGRTATQTRMPANCPAQLLVKVISVMLSASGEVYMMCHWQCAHFAVCCHAERVDRSWLPPKGTYAQ